MAIRHTVGVVEGVQDRRYTVRWQCNVVVAIAVNMELSSAWGGFRVNWKIMYEKCSGGLGPD